MPPKVVASFDFICPNLRGASSAAESKPKSSINVNLSHFLSLYYYVQIYIYIFWMALYEMRMCVFKLMLVLWLVFGRILGFLIFQVLGLVLEAILVPTHRPWFPLCWLLMVLRTITHWRSCLRINLLRQLKICVRLKLWLMIRWYGYLQQMVVSQLSLHTRDSIEMLIFPIGVLWIGKLYAS